MENVSGTFCTKKIKDHKKNGNNKKTICNNNVGESPLNANNAENKHSESVNHRDLDNSRLSSANVLWFTLNILSTGSQRSFNFHYFLNSKLSALIVDEKLNISYELQLKNRGKSGLTCAAHLPQNLISIFSSDTSDETTKLIPFRNLFHVILCDFFEKFGSVESHVDLNLFAQDDIIRDILSETFKRGTFFKIDLSSNDFEGLYDALTNSLKRTRHQLVSRSRQLTWISRNNMNANRDKLNAVIESGNRIKDCIVADFSTAPDHTSHGVLLALTEDIPLRRCRLPKFAVHQTASTIIVVLHVQNINFRTLTKYMCDCYSVCRIDMNQDQPYQGLYRVVFSTPDCAFAGAENVDVKVEKESVTIRLDKAAAFRTLWTQLEVGPVGFDQLKAWDLTSGDLLQRADSVTDESVNGCGTDRSSLTSVSSLSSSRCSEGVNTTANCFTKRRTVSESSALLSRGSSGVLDGGDDIGMRRRCNSGGILRNWQAYRRTVSECSDSLEFSSWEFDISSEMSSMMAMVDFEDEQTPQQHNDTATSGGGASSLQRKKSVHFSDTVERSVFVPGSSASSFRSSPLRGRKFAGSYHRGRNGSLSRQISLNDSGLSSDDDSGAALSHNHHHNEVFVMDEDLFPAEIVNSVINNADKNRHSVNLRNKRNNHQKRNKNGSNRKGNSQRNCSEDNTVIKSVVCSV